MLYIDSSVLLELYFGGTRWKEAQALLYGPDRKISSWLLMIEVPVVLRRRLEGRALEQALARFDDDAREIAFVDSSTDVSLRVRSDERFASCRSLDAIHACTALLMREWTGMRVQLMTFDQRLTALAQAFALT